MHKRNKHQARYNFQALIKSYPDLAQYVKPNNYKEESINFFDAEAVKALNKALLKHHYGIDQWDIPQHYLCPPIPGRADYIHYIADLLAFSNNGKIPRGDKIQCLDIGVGANCIYPIIGNKEYHWQFIGTDIDPVAIQSAQNIIENNPSLKGKIELRLQTQPQNIFSGIILKNERIDLTICNPPFHASLEEAQAGTIRKLNNLKKKKHSKAKLNFGGKQSELYCEGGERKFIKDMIQQSKEFSSDCFWFSTLVSKESNLKPLYAILKKEEPTQIETIPIEHGNKKSRILTWTFLNPKQQRIWPQMRWQ